MVILLALISFLLVLRHPLCSRDSRCFISLLDWNGGILPNREIEPPTTSSQLRSEVVQEPTIRNVRDIGILDF